MISFPRNRYLQWITLRKKYKTVVIGNFVDISGKLPMCVRYLRYRLPHLRYRVTQMGYVGLG